MYNKPLHILHRIKIIRFDIALRGFYEKDTVEKHNSVESNFNIAIILDNRVHANHIEIKIELDLVLKRVDDSCKSSFRYSTVIDILVTIVSILTSVTHIYSLYNTALLAKVYMTTM